METETYFGTRFDNVRVELTQGANQKASGMENASVCVVKIPNANLPKPYKAPEVWNDLTTEEMLENFTLDTEGKNFFVIVKKSELGIDIDVPVGLIDQDETISTHTPLARCDYNRRPRIKLIYNFYSHTSREV